MLKDFQTEIKTFFIVVFVAIVIALGGILIWQNSLENSLRDRLGLLSHYSTELRASNEDLIRANTEVENQNNSFKSEIEKLGKEKENFKKRISQLTSGISTVEAQGVAGDRFLRLLAPNRSENLCLGEEYEIRWESRDRDHVDLTVLKGGYGYRIAEYYPAASGVYRWKVGLSNTGIEQNFPALGTGDGFSVRITSFDFGIPISDESDQLFTITRCQG